MKRYAVLQMNTKRFVVISHGCSLGEGANGADEVAWFDPTEFVYRNVLDAMAKARELNRELAERQAAKAAKEQAK